MNETKGKGRFFFGVIISVCTLTGCAVPSSSISMASPTLMPIVSQTPMPTAAPTPTLIPGYTKDGDAISSDEYYSYEFPLLAEIPEKQIYLYGSQGNVADCILFVGDIYYHYEIPYLTPRFNLPELKLADFDGDGVEELAIKYYYGCGTGYSVWGLDIIKIYTDTGYSSPWPVYTFYPPDYLAQANAALSYKALDDTGNKFEITVGNQKVTHDFTDMLTENGDAITDIFCSGDNVDFDFSGDGVVAKIDIGASHKAWGEPEEFELLTADCNFTGSGFTLSNFDFGNS